MERHTETKVVTIDGLEFEINLEPGETVTGGMLIIKTENADDHRVGLQYDSDRMNWMERIGALRYAMGREAD